jgi:hypothetical protein
MTALNDRAIKMNGTPNGAIPNDANSMTGWNTALTPGIAGQSKIRSAEPRK